MQGSRVKKNAVSGETIASFAKRTGTLNIYATRGAEVFGTGGWKKVGMEYKIRAGEKVRPAASGAEGTNPFDILSFLSKLVRRGSK
jgi:hypothetical protein